MAESDKLAFMVCAKCQAVLNLPPWDVRRIKCPKCGRKQNAANRDN